MSGKRTWLTILLAVVGLAGGVGLGLWYGWIVDPVEWTDTDIPTCTQPTGTSSS